jgi:hypothetical protein
MAVQVVVFDVKVAAVLDSVVGLQLVIEVPTDIKQDSPDA